MSKNSPEMDKITVFLLWTGLLMSVATGLHFKSPMAGTAVFCFTIWFPLCLDYLGEVLKKKE